MQLRLSYICETMLVSSIFQEWPGSFCSFSHGLQLSFRYQVNSVFVIAMGSGLEIATDTSVQGTTSIITVPNFFP